jgi:phage-related protein
MATSVGSAYVTLIPSMTGFASKFSQEFGSSGSKSGKSFGDGFSSGVDGAVNTSSGLLSKLGNVASTVATGAAVGFSALTAGVTAIGGAALNAYADYEQLVGGVDTLFGSASGKLQGYAAEAYATCGLSANQYMEQATSFAASLVSSCGGDVSAAADYANTAMGDMADNVNKMGSNMTDVQNAYQGFAKQNYTMLDNLKLGYGGTQSEMQRLIDDANELKAANGETADLTIDSYADIVEAIHTVQQEMGITGTTGEEAATTISGSIGMAKAAWENFVTGLGRDDVDFSQLTEQLLSSIGAVATNVAPRVAQIGQGIINAFPTVLAGLGTVLAPVLSEALATAWNIAVNALAGLGISLPNVDASQITGAFQAIADFAGTVVEAVRTAFTAIGPIVSTVASTVSGAVSGLMAAAQPFAAYFTGNMLPALASVATSVVSLFNAVAPTVSGVFTAIQNVAAAFLPVVQNAFAQLTPLVGQALSLVAQIGTALSPFIAQVGSVLGPALTSIGTALANLANAVLPVLASGLQIVFSVVQALMPVLSTVASVVGSIVSVVITVVAQVISVVVNAVATVTSVIGVVTSAISGLVALISTAVGTVLSVVGGIISTIVATVSGAVNTVVTTIGSMVSSVLAFCSSLFSSMNSIFNSIVSTLSNAASQVYSAVTGAFNNLVSGVSGACGSLMSTVSGIPSQIMGVFSGIGTWLVDSGASLINGLTQGIQSAIGGAVDAVSGALSTIRSYFPFSPAKRGPFSGHGYTTYSGAALMGDWGKGMAAATEGVVSSVTGVMDAVQSGLAADVSLGTGSVTVSRSDAADGVSLLASAIDALKSAETAIYVDGKKLASTIAKPMNQQLGLLAARGY